MNYSAMLSRCLLLFWSCWISTVFASNLVDGMQQAELVPASWRFSSGNYAMVDKAVGIYSFTSAWAPVLFGTVIAIQLAASLLFWRAFFDRECVRTAGHPKVVQPVVVVAGLFAGFLFADEVFIVYERQPGMETTHFLVLCALLLSLVVISQLSNDARASR